jgi:hypothetical protein
MMLVYVRSSKQQTQSHLIDLFQPLAVSYEPMDAHTSCFYMDSEAYVQAKILIPTLQEDMGESFLALGGFDNRSLMMQAMDVALDFAQNQLLDLADLLVISIIQKDERIFALLKQSLEKLAQPLLETAKMMVLCSGHSKLAAQLLYLHRNTFLYRLNRFMDETGIDLRESHHLAVFKVFFLISEHQSISHLE